MPAQPLIFLPGLVTQAPPFLSLVPVGPLDPGAAPSAAGIWSLQGPSTLPGSGEEADGSQGYPPSPISLPSFATTKALWKPQGFSGGLPSGSGSVYHPCSGLTRRDRDETVPSWSVWSAGPCDWTGESSRSGARGPTRWQCRPPALEGGVPRTRSSHGECHEGLSRPS